MSLNFPPAAARAFDNRNRLSIMCHCIGMPVIRKLVLGTLLAIMPFSGLRVIYVDSPADVSRSSPRNEEGADCARLCPLHQPSRTESGSECALSADASLQSLFASVAIPLPQEPPQVPLVVAHTCSDSPGFYLEPALAHLGPPPRPQAL